MKRNNSYLQAHCDVCGVVLCKNRFVSAIVNTKTNTVFSVSKKK
jgi:hypothetical protein